LNVLLDTHAFIWWISDNSRLSERARGIIGEAGNEVFFSAASGWEIAIKVRIGRLKLATEHLEEFILEQLAANGFQVLPVTLQHALRTYLLPDDHPENHKDPFDRLLVAQAEVENLTLLSADQRLADYGIRLLW
jgi:PIN domain nuclease of toxin-antitoxin system